MNKFEGLFTELALPAVGAIRGVIIIYTAKVIKDKSVCGRHHIQFQTWRCSNVSHEASQANWYFCDVPGTWQGHKWSDLSSCTLAGKSFAHVSCADFADLMFWEIEAE